MVKKRYHLVLPEETFEQVKAAAEKRDTTAVDLLRRFIRLGLIALKAEDDPDAALILREGNRETKLILI